MQMTR